MRIATLAALSAIAFAAPAQADCLADLKSVLTGSLTGGPYLMELVSDDMTMTAEVVPPASIHATTHIGGATQEMTVHDGKAWMQMGGAWTAMPDSMAAQMTAGISGAAGMIDQVAGAECLGTQNFEGKDYLAFKYDFAMAGVESSSTLYADPATKLPLLILGTSTAAGKTTATRATYRYDPSVTVSAPM
ncbi:hypothetical protein LJR016_004615 [Devosia sp. LjRoot16]|uniref:hypothetical protein n=1 Tax=Devosia sp. LjRoot16 TaxID=3342271 RepID=UPI003ECD9DE1